MSKYQVIFSAEAQAILNRDKTHYKRSDMWHEITNFEQRSYATSRTRIQAGTAGLLQERVSGKEQWSQAIELNRYQCPPAYAKNDQIPSTHKIPLSAPIQQVCYVFFALFP